MKRFRVAAVALTASLALQGCALLYPHWGETALPSDSPTQSQTPIETSTPTPTPTPSKTETQPPKNKVTVEITDYYVDSAAGVLDIIASITDVFEEGGTCALTVTSGSSSATDSAKAGQNVTDTQCGLLEVQIADLESGTASFRVSYTSPTSQGRSDLIEVEIP